MARPKDLPALSKLCDFATIHAFAVLSDDFNPIHVDRAFAATTPMGGLIAHGPMSLGLLWQALHKALGPEDVARLALNVRFLRPVREDDVITAGGRLKPDGEAAYELWVRNQNDELVITGEAAVGG